MTPTVEGAGVELAYDERGDGQPLVLVHGTACTRAVWDELLGVLGDGHRAIRYDRRGYGESGAPEPYISTAVGEQADDLAALVRSLDAAPCLLCGHDWGGLACLEALLQHPGLASAAVVIEPPMLWLSPNGAEATSDVTAAVERGASEGGGAGAVQAFVEAVCGPRAAATLGPDRMEAAREAPGAFAADASAANAWSVAPRELRGLDVPVVVLRGTRSLPVWREAAAELAEMLPRAELREAESGHLMPIEAPNEVAGAVALAQLRVALAPKHVGGQ